MGIALAIGLAVALGWLIFQRTSDPPALPPPESDEQLRLRVLLEKRERQLHVDETLLHAAESLLGAAPERGYRESVDPFANRYRERVRQLAPSLRTSYERCRAVLDSLKSAVDGGRLDVGQLEHHRERLLYDSVPGDPDERPLLSLIRSINRDWETLAMLLELIDADISSDTGRRMIRETLDDLEEFLRRPMNPAKKAALLAMRERIRAAVARDKVMAAIEELPELQRQIGRLRTRALSARVLELAGRV